MLPVRLSAPWYADGTFWTIASVVVALVLGVVTVWAQFASANRAREQGTQQHGLIAAVADVLGLAPSSDSAPAERIGPDLSGTWTAGWQSFKDGQEVFRYQPVQLQHLGGDAIQVTAIERGAEVEDGGYLWRGGFRIWDNSILLGWYAATDSAVRSKGTLYFTIHPHGHTMTGKWVGLSHDGLIVSGWATLARAPEHARRAMQDLTT